MNQSLHFNFLREFNMSAFYQNVYNTCAVVGSSSRLLRTAEGVRIDAHTAVIRANDYPIVKYASFLGRKTSLVISTFSRHLKPNSATIYYCHTRWVHPCWYNVYRDKFPRLSPKFIMDVKRAYGISQWPTTGFLAIAFARIVCKTTTIFGFGIDPSFSNCTHYYNVGRSGCVYPQGQRHYSNSHRNYFKYTTVGWHNIQKEEKIVQNLMEHPTAMKHVK